MRRLRLLAVIAAAASVAAASVAVAKFGPGTVSICGVDACVAVEDQATVTAFNRWYFAGSRPTRVRPPRPGSAAIRIRTRIGLAGIVAAPRYDRALAGLNCGRFRNGRWYRVPPSLRTEIARLATGLEPSRVPRTPPRFC